MRDEESPITFFDLDTYCSRCETEAPKYVDAKFCTPSWAKKIRNEYADILYDVCKRNFNQKSGIFSTDGVDMDLAGAIGGFLRKHPHIDYVCPTPWRTRVLALIKTNFTEASNKIRKDKAVLGEDEEVAAPERDMNPNQPVSQTMHDVSNRVWSAWRVLTDLLSGQLVTRYNAGEVEDKNFQNAIKIRDSLKKLAADVDDLSLAFQIVKKDENEDDDED